MALTESFGVLPTELPFWLNLETHRSMALESRSRMISFRLTHEEYNRFRHMCVTRGLRNVSELVRTAVNQMFEMPAPASSAKSSQEIELRVAKLEARLLELATAVKHLSGQDDDEHMNSEPLKFRQAASS